MLSLSIVAVLLAACSAGPTAPSSGATSPDPSGSPSASDAVSPTPTPTPEDEAAFLPPPDRPLPRRPEALAAGIERVYEALELSVDRWVTDGDIFRRRPPRDVVWQSLYQQRAFRLLVRNRPLRRPVLRRLSPAIRERARRNLAAGVALRTLVTPVEGGVTFRTQAPESAGDLLRYYRAAQRRFDVDWEVLAAINSIETRMGRIRSRSSAGARGPMQFIPSTWDAYGMGGDVDDPRDAILGAANYLRASGAPGDYRRALFAYNHADAYVDAVLAYANEMRGDASAYFAYYNWQVFVLTTKGDRRLTGPGR